jgi:hypothetical protein
VEVVSGLYESLINQFVDTGIEEAASKQQRPERRALDSANHTYLAQYRRSYFRKAFSSIIRAKRLLVVYSNDYFNGTYGLTWKGNQ